MKKIPDVLVLAVTFVAGAVVSAQVRDWHDLDAIHKHVVESINEMERARSANHYDMRGHGEKAEQLLRQAEHELNLAIEAARTGR